MTPLERQLRDALQAMVDRYAPSPFEASRRSYDKALDALAAADTPREPIGWRLCIPFTTRENCDAAAVLIAKQCVSFDMHITPRYSDDTEYPLRPVAE
jgi:hypothetical protein